MKRPPYHLRPNKAADRFALIEAIRRLERLGNLEEYTYYGLGGSFLEDFRLLYEFYPTIKMISVEEDEEIYKCQQFHLPCGILHLENTDLTSYITQYEPSDKKSIFWLDYTRLEHSCFEDFKALLGKVAAMSMIKVTLRAEPKDYWRRYKPLRKRKAEEFRKKFESIMPDASSNPPRKSEDFAYLVQEMLQITTQQALPAEATPLMFQPVSSFYYSNGTGMFTLTGIVCLRDEKVKVNEAFNGWEFANLTWAKPKLINVPILSTKERLHLQHCLPCMTSAGNTLRAKLGYLIDDDIPKTEAALEQYAVFHRYSPYFMRTIP